MRLSHMIVVVLVLAGCGSPNNPPARPNQTMLSYPSGPFGYVQGSAIQNIKFLGKIDASGAAGTANYATLPLKEFSLADYHNDATVKYLMLSGVAGWCVPCNDEQDGITPNGQVNSIPQLQAKYEPMGVRFVEAMIQGYNEGTGAPATESDINRWATFHHLHLAIATDPEDKIHQYADIAAFPLNMFVSTSDMKIQFMMTGETDMDPVIASYIK